MKSLIFRIGERAVNLVLLVLLLPVLLGVTVVLLLAGLLARRQDGHTADEMEIPASQETDRPPCSIVIPNWNGKDLLEKYLPSVVQACQFELGDEVIVVDNHSEDGSAQYVASMFPQVRLLALEENRGFGGGCNAGIRAAKNRYVTLLNSDMRVEPDFLAPLLEPFANSKVFAVSAQIRFSDPHKRREESGLTYARLTSGQLHLGHDLDCDSTSVVPCFYPGGGSAAFDREKLLALGGFDDLYRPFYLEDTDLGFQAWKRGWVVLYQPRSVVYHEHRGTIGKRFSPAFIDSIVQKNRILFGWKHFDSASQTISTQGRLLADLLANVFRGQARHRAGTRAVLRALRQFPEAIAARYSTKRRSTFAAREAMRFHTPDVYFDRFVHRYDPTRRLQVLFVSPYPLFPAVHGGAVLMTQALRHLSRHADVHLVVLLEDESERGKHLGQSSSFASMNLLVRRSTNKGIHFGLRPKAVREFCLPELDAAIRRLILEHQIDVVQLEYTQFAQYAGQYESIITALFEHDVYFQTVGRLLTTQGASSGPKTALEYLRALRFELKAIPRCDYVQVCTQDNADYLSQFVPSLRGKLDPALRAGIDTSRYEYRGVDDRMQKTLLFIGNFRHVPNQDGLLWLIHHVMPQLARSQPDVVLRVVGANAHHLPLGESRPGWLDIRGEVEDVVPHLQECGIFVCPVLTGSGVRVKLLEAFASGIPVVATPVGAEGLLYEEEPVCLLAKDPAAFAAAIERLMKEPATAAELSRRARELVMRDWDAETNTERLVARYRDFLGRKAIQRHSGKVARAAALVTSAPTG